MGISCTEMELFGKGYGVRLAFGSPVQDDKHIAAAFDRADRVLHVRLAIK